LIIDEGRDEDGEPIASMFYVAYPVDKGERGMKRRPVSIGYYDMATAFFGTEYDLKHMQFDTAQHDNITLIFYDSGHLSGSSPQCGWAMPHSDGIFNRV